MKQTIAYLFLIFAGVSCISIKSEYPSINYYKLEPPQVAPSQNSPIEKILQIKDIQAGPEIPPTRLTAINQDGSVQIYYYHRWMANCSDMLSSYFIELYNRHNIFSGGVISAKSMLVPDYFLEGRVLKMIATNSEDENGNNYVQFSVKISLLKRSPLKNNSQVLISKIYESKIDRKNNKAASIAPAMEKAVFEAAQKILNDIKITLQNA